MDDRERAEEFFRVENALAWCLLALALAALLYGALRTWPRTVDDTFIPFRYAVNLNAGAGPVFNPGERVEGYSSPSWMLLSAGALGVGVDPVPVAKVAGLGASVLLVSLLFVAARRAGVSRTGGALAALLLGGSVVLQIWAVAGMETNAYALAFFAGLVALASGRIAAPTCAAASAFLVVAALTRPEGLAFWALGLPVAVARSPRRRVSAAVYAAPGIALAGFFAWRLAYYGQPLPNTYYVKTGGGPELWRQGLEGLGLFVTNLAHWPWLAAAVAGTVVGLRSAKSRSATAIMAGATLLHLAWIVSVGDDGLRIHRFYPPVLAPLAFLTVMVFRRESAATLSPRRLRALVGIGASLAIAGSARALHGEILGEFQENALVYQEGNERLGRLLRATRPAGTRIAVAAAGAIPYYSGLPTIDMYGLNDAHIAHQPFPAARTGRLMKWDNAYVLAARPELIVINRGYFRAGDPMAAEAARNPGILAESAADRDLFRRLQEERAYGLRTVRFPDGAVFFVFERAGGGTP